MAEHHQSTNTKRGRKKPDGPLTALDVRARSEPGYHPDKDGLYLSISKSGAKSWIFKYDFQGKRHEIGLGSVKAVSLSHARQKSLECRRQILEGTNPLLAKIKAKQQAALDRARTVTFDECAAAYIKAHKESWKNPKHAQQWENTLETYASCVFQTKLDTESTPNWTASPGQSGHPVHGKLDTDSRPNWTPLS